MDTRTPRSTPPGSPPRLDELLRQDVLRKLRRLVAWTERPGVSEATLPEIVPGRASGTLVVERHDPRGRWRWTLRRGDDVVGPCEIDGYRDTSAARAAALEAIAMLVAPGGK